MLEEMLRGELERSHACCVYINIRIFPFETMSVDTHNMMMRVIMASMTPGVC